LIIIDFVDEIYTSEEAGKFEIIDVRFEQNSVSERNCMNIEMKEIYDYSLSNLSFTGNLTFKKGSALELNLLNQESQIEIQEIYFLNCFGESESCLKVY
jgi:hypothetical protein